jgi:integrase
LQKRLPGLWRNQGLVFATETGTSLHRGNLRSCYFKPLLEKPVSPTPSASIIYGTHALRYYSAQGCALKLLQELLGHATISITLDTYSLPPKAETGQELGEVEVFVGGQSVGRSALVAQEGYEEASL